MLDEKSHLFAALLAQVQDSIMSLTDQRTRTGLALLGIVIGATSVVAMLCIGHMSQVEAAKAFQSVGLNTLLVQASANDSSQSLKTTTIDNISRKIPGIDLAVPVTMVNTGSGDLPVGATAVVEGVPPEIQPLLDLKVSSGRFLTVWDAGAASAVVGAKVAEQLASAPGHKGVGSEIRIGRSLFLIVGVLSPQPPAAMSAVDADNSILISEAMAAHISGQASVNVAYLRIAPPLKADDVKDKVTAYLNAAAPGAGINVQSPRALIQSITEQKKVQGQLLAAIGAVSLLVGGIGVMNVMLMSVLERQREIGLRVAIGATPSAIERQFLAEATVLSLIGGLAGAILGMALAVCAAMGWKWGVSIPLYAPLAGVVMAMTMGIIFGLYPARKASRLSPIEALRAN